MLLLGARRAADGDAQDEAVEPLANERGNSARVILRKPSRNLENTGFSVKVVGTETRVAAKEYTVYIVDVVDRDTQREFKIFKRFSDFDELHSKLKKQYPNLPVLPKKTIFSSMSAKVMEGRKLGLDSYLQQLAMRLDVLESSGELRTFLELDQARMTQEGIFVARCLRR